ncbi:MAG: flavodoxin family protein [Syntrophomonadaceae bacterium]
MTKALIVAINGSPNRDGNTSFMLREALSECEKMEAETRLIQCRDALKDQRNPFCQACSSPCSGKCLEGKEIKKYYELISQADGLLVGSPVYFGTLTGQLKAFWDKTRLIRGEKRLLNVVGGALAVGGSRFGGQETTLRAIHDIFLVHGMIIVGDGYQEDDCGHIGAAAQRPAQEDMNGIKRAHILGKRVAQLAIATRELRKRG